MRKSNFELLRIISMILIISHHFVVNSGIIPEAAPVPANLMGNYIFLACFGMWGKTCINIFLMISGYFMCKSRLTTERYCKVLFVYLFYHYMIYFALLFLRYETISVSRIFHLLFEVFEEANYSGEFINSFLIFYLFIPFINLFLEHADKTTLRSLVLLLLFVFSGLSTFFNNKSLIGECFWFIALYCMGACIRMYPFKWMQDMKKCCLYLIASLVMSYGSVIGIILVLSRFGMNNNVYFVNDANKLGAVLVSVFAFCVFKNLNIGYSKVINAVAKTTFGVLLIHSNSPALRNVLWNKIIHAERIFDLPLGYLAIRSVGTVLLIFTVCSFMDFCRIHVVERPLKKYFSAVDERINSMLNAAIKQISDA